MNAYIRDYDKVERLCVVAKDRVAFTKLAERKATIFCLGQEQIFIWPDNVCFPLENMRREHIDALKNHDIVEIGASGLVYRAFANEEPDATLFMGGGCNSNCIMCPASDLERKIASSFSREHLMKYIEYLPDFLEYLVITGGEPTLNPSLFLDALEKVAQKYQDARILLLSNGRSFSNNQFFEETLKRLPARFRIAIPVHSADPKLHDAITRSDGSYMQTAAAIRKFLQAGVDVEIRIVVTKANAEHILPIAQLIALEYPTVNRVNFIGLEPRGNCAKDFDRVFINYRDSFNSSRESIDYLIAHGIDVGLYNYPLCNLDRNYWPIAFRSISLYKNVFRDICNECDVKNICPGLFTFADRLVQLDLKPQKIGGEQLV